MQTNEVLSFCSRRHALHVTIIRGRNISGRDAWRKPQCYVQLRLPSASSETFRTSAVRNSANPTWRQTFTFYIHTTLKNVMELILFDDDRTVNNQISSLCVDLGGLKMGGREREKIVLDEKKRMLLEVEFFLEKSESHPHPVFTNGVLMARQCWKVQVCVLHLRGLPAEGIHSHAIVLSAPDSYERIASTTKRKGAEPVWDEYFTFHTDSGRDNLLFVTLHDTSHMSELASHFGRATAVGKGSCQLNALPLNQTVKITVPIDEGLQVDLNLTATDSASPILRLGFCLSDGEKDFLKRRAKIAALAFTKVLNHQTISKSCRVPVVAVLGSGGGVRAMTSFYGSLSGLERMGILDCIAYAFGVSGSNWALATIYQDPCWSTHGLDSAIHELRARLTGGKLNLLTSDWLRHCRDALRDKEARGLRTCLTDLWGFVLEWMLYGQENPARLSEQQEAVRHGQNPYPIYAAVNVKRDVESCKFSEWVEFTPHEVGLPKYGAFIPARNFESEFFMGHMVRQHPEPPLHYLLGLWGSAFAKSLRDLFNDLLKKQNSPDGKQDTEKQEPLVDRDLAQVSLQSKDLTELTGVTVPASSARGIAEEALSIEVSTPERFIKQVLHEALGTRLSVSHVPNFLSGHFLVQNFEQFPDFSPWKDNSCDHHSNQLSPFMKKLHLVDAGLSINLAFPLAQRSQRRAHLILSFDYSWDKPFENIMYHSHPWMWKQTPTVSFVSATSLKIRAMRAFRLFFTSHLSTRVSETSLSQVFLGGPKLNRKMATSKCLYAAHHTARLTSVIQNVNLIAWSNSHDTTSSTMLHSFTRLSARHGIVPSAKSWVNNGVYESRTVLHDEHQSKSSNHRADSFWGHDQLVLCRLVDSIQKLLLCTVHLIFLQEYFDLRWLR